MAIEIETTVPPLTTSVTEQRYGHWIKRILGFSIDQLVTSPFLLAGYVLGALALGGDGRPGFLLGFGAATAYGLAIGFYNRCIRMGLTGQSWGKMATGTRLVSEATGDPIGVGKALIRDMAHMLDLVALGIGVLMPLWDDKRQTFADKIVRTIVIEHDPTATTSIPPLP